MSEFVFCLEGLLYIHLSGLESAFYEVSLCLFLQANNILVNTELDTANNSLVSISRTSKSMQV